MVNVYAMPGTMPAIKVTDDVLKTYVLVAPGNCHQMHLKGISWKLQYPSPAVQEMFREAYFSRP